MVGPRAPLCRRGWCCDVRARLHDRNRLDTPWLGLGRLGGSNARIVAEADKRVVYRFVSTCVSERDVSKSPSGAPDNALPRHLTLWTRAKTPKYRRKCPADMPRCGRRRDLSCCQKPQGRPHQRVQDYSQRGINAKPPATGKNNVAST